MTPTMQINEKDAQRLLHWQDLAARVTGMDAEDIAMVARIRAAFPSVEKLERAKHDFDRRTKEAEQDPRVKAVRERLYETSMSSPEYDKLLDELMRVRQGVVMELEAKEKEDGEKTLPHGR